MGFSDIYWRFFNFFVRRVIAITWVVIGLVIAFANVPLLLPGATIEVDGTSTDDLVYRVCAVVLPLLAAIAGVLLFRTEPYRPRK